jgi:F0F1-type ATP synthase membrane subunit b/b'
VLYFFSSRVILPRILAILKNRKSVIDADLSSAALLDEKIYQLQILTDNLRKESNQKYQTQIEESAKNAAKKREKTIEEFKEKFEEINQKSRQEIKNFVAQATLQSEAAVEDLTQKIVKKLLNN